MAVILWMMSLSLLMHGCLCSPGLITGGCLRWTPSGQEVCCEACHPGHRLVKKCGLDPKELCTPCESGKFILNPKAERCTLCTQCIDAQVLVKNCTATSDTMCGCRKGLICGDADCNFCVEPCGKGQEPSGRSCKACPHGTFNDKMNSKCKPWSTKCPKPNQKIEVEGDAFNDIKCGNASIPTVIHSKKPDDTEQAWPMVLSAVTSVVLMAFSIIVIIIAAMKILKKRKKVDKPIKKTPVIRTPTDDPRTLIAIECSFHEAQQEQGSSSESLNSKDSSEQLIA
ncbi:tumor necrosis factor receptor superfamily member 9a isoform X2 [Stegastes partitus]|uniref:Tumor necrosis factor receptor superfamily member 9-like n=1 Tax=Stegastes partitus TaxID=144197 RepID=A0A3B5AWE1_9TELE|nr:PREDICTED: tumor necrosis factor receptor superfamily member 9-like isoform X2 [Stegastes partitus]